MNTGIAPEMLTLEQMESYRRDGYLVFDRPLFSDDELNRLETIVHGYLGEVRAGRREAHLNVPHFEDARMFEFLMDSRVLDLVESIVGPDIALWTSQFFCKEAETGKAIGWHADAHYWADFIDPVDVVSVWLAMDDVGADNGCMRFLPGSHKGVEVRYEKRGEEDNPFFPLRIRPEDIDESRAIDVELRRGEFVMFDGYLLHGSNANTGVRRRFSYTMRYMPTTCRFYATGRRRRTVRSMLGAIRRKLTGRQVYTHRIYLARGRDRAGNAYTPWR